jgi:chromosome segregation ATPase
MAETEHHRVYNTARTRAEFIEKQLRSRKKRKRKQVIRFEPEPWLEQLLELEKEKHPEEQVKYRIHRLIQKGIDTTKTDVVKVWSQLYERDMEETKLDDLLQQWKKKLESQEGMITRKNAEIESLKEKIADLEKQLQEANSQKARELQPNQTMVIPCPEKLESVPLDACLKCEKYVDCSTGLAAFKIRNKK